MNSWTESPSLHPLTELFADLTVWFALAAVVLKLVAQRTEPHRHRLGTPWGLIRHYWVVGKLALTVLAAGVLLLHLGPIVRVGEAALEGAFSGGTMYPVRVQLVANAGAALLVLLVTTAFHRADREATICVR